MRKLTFGLILSLLLLPLVFAANYSSNDILGEWYTKDDGAKVRIYEENGKYYGEIIWLSEPFGMDGEPKKDTNNPKKTLRSRPIVGINLIRDFVYKGKGKWEKGKIYNPEDGKTYSCVIKMIENGQKLKVRGYVGISLFGQTQIWRRP